MKTFAVGIIIVVGIALGVRAQQQKKVPDAFAGMQQYHIIRQDYDAFSAKTKTYDELKNIFAVTKGQPIAMSCLNAGDGDAACFILVAEPYDPQRLTKAVSEISK